MPQRRPILLALSVTLPMKIDPNVGEQVGYFGESLLPSRAGELLSEFKSCTYDFGVEGRK